VHDSETNSEKFQRNFRHKSKYPKKQQSGGAEAPPEMTKRRSRSTARNDKAAVPKHRRLAN